MKRGLTTTGITGQYMSTLFSFKRGIRWTHCEEFFSCPKIKGCSRFPSNTSPLHQTSGVALKPISHVFVIFSTKLGPEPELGAPIPELFT